jgi:hypothetical protein
MIFIIGSRTMWSFVLNMYFDEILTLVTPMWMQTFPFPRWFIALFKLALFVVDWAHTFLPIYIVLEWLLTTFPAKEEQMTMRETIAEVRLLREFNQQNMKRDNKTRENEQRKNKGQIRELQQDE